MALENEINFNIGEVQENDTNQEITNSDVETPVSSEMISTDKIIEQNQKSDYDILEIYNFLKDNGIAPEIENPNFDDIGDIASLINNRIKEQTNYLLEQQINQYDQAYKDLVNYINNGGDIDTFRENYRNSYENMDFKDIKNNSNIQEKIILDYYRKTTNWTDDIIKKHISKFEQDEIEDFSRTALQQLKNLEVENNKKLIEEQKFQQIQIQQYYEQLTQEYKKQLNDLNTLGSDIKITLEDKRQIENNLFGNKTFEKLYNDFDKYRLTLSILDNYGILDDINNINKLLNNKQSNNKSYNFKKNKTNETDNDTNINMEIIQNNSSKQNNNNNLPFIF